MPQHHQFALFRLLVQRGIVRLLPDQLLLEVHSRQCLHQYDSILHLLWYLLLHLWSYCPQTRLAEWNMHHFRTVFLLGHPPLDGRVRQLAQCDPFCGTRRSVRRKFSFRHALHVHALILPESVPWYSFRRVQRDSEIGDHHVPNGRRSSPAHPRPHDYSQLPWGNCCDTVSQNSSLQ